MKAYLKSITAKSNLLKLHFDNGNSSKYVNYISALNEIYGYQLLKNDITVEPENLVCPEKELNIIVAKLYEYFHAILDVDIEYNFTDYQTQNNTLCCGFDVFGKSFITIKTRKH